ncbi:Adenylyltransferase and sulfurtransferase-like protein [Emericellopsis cladophorae]|uniref:Adenylyltransferase and sulfurtransferase uba4 n=1 Tax=Emericellopsis cladophorae TaxID=2686198 RepID=A0A9P9Y9R9_9HYPO|nr:Adenylyltransferase and sulfurtransferase-like protein [Emericellopsis cladophorae]KAI6785459.1 Adenylyltransferase and sulfurtransferase-like protein [Emericellopsis cladophorae]
MDRIDHLRREISLRESELAELRSQLALAESEHRLAKQAEPWAWPLSGEEYLRYSRQMIVPNFGIEAQLQLKAAKILIIGAGGLGCPAATYLAAAGPSHIGLVDGDTVEKSNLHRQFAHATSRVGQTKVSSAITFLKDLNPNVAYKAYQTNLSTSNAEEIVREWDIVLDCTDHPTSRYLISDICTLLGKRLVSASAFQKSGQMMVLNDPPGQGPCYRCVFPKPPPPESVVGCGEGGILGPVVGTMGVLQALETLKVINREAPPEKNMMLLFSGMAETPFRSIRMRGKRKDCFACGENPSLTLEGLQTSMDYVQFCGVRQPVSLLQPEERISVKDYAESIMGKGHVLLDVREKELFGLCHLAGAVNIPIGRFMNYRGEEVPHWVTDTIPGGEPIYVVCRVGNDSQIAAQKLMDMGLGKNGRFIGDIEGGLVAWKQVVDPDMPFT